MRTLRREEREIGDVTIHNTKLKFFDNLGDPIDDLGFAQVDLRAFWRLHCASIKDSRSWQGKSNDSFARGRLEARQGPGYSK